MRLLYKTGPMESLRKWFYKPKRDDRSLLAQFFFADDALNIVAAELDSFDGRKDPERCSTLVNQLRHAQDRVLNITSQIMDQVLGDERVARGFRVKFPEDVLQDNLAGQLWFGAECLAAGSSIMNREEESAAMRPLAKALTRSLETVRSLLREQCLRPRGLALSQHDDMLHESLRIFDRLFAQFELCYVSAMVNVKTPHEFEAQQFICVLFSESLRRALKQSLLTQEQVDSYDPALMFAVPRLAIVNGLLIYSSGPLSIDKSPEEMSDMFRPFRTLLHKIRSLLWTLDRRELIALERLLCTNEDVSNIASLQLQTATGINDDSSYPDIGEFVSRFYADHAHCRDLYTQQSSSEHTITDADYLPDNIEVMTPILDGLRRLTNDSEDTEGHESEIDTKPDRYSIDTTSTDTFLTNDYDRSRKTSKIENNDLSSLRNLSTGHESEIDTKPDRFSIDTTSTDTFQTNEYNIDRSRKTSKNENNDLSSLRNLSTNGLMMFDPLVINAAASTSSNANRIDEDLISSLNEQVTAMTAIADRLSSIAVSDNIDSIIDQKHSFSTNDVPTLIEDEAFGYSGPRNEQLSCMPSTSHGYLIPNAISHEPAVLSSLSHNNSAVFNQDDEGNDLNVAILNHDLPLIIPDNIEAEIVNTNISITNANLSLILNEEYSRDVVDDNASFHSAKMVLDSDEKVKFMLGYESDHESPVDSGVSTESTSLDRSPESEQNKEVDYKNTIVSDTDEKDNITEVVNINYVEDDQKKNESSSIDVRLNQEEEEVKNNTNREAIRVLQEWGANTTEEEYKNIDDVITELRRNRESDKRSNTLVERSEEGPSQGSSRIKKNRKAIKRKKSKMWSPGAVILDNRSMQNQSPLRLNLDHFVDESGTSCGTSECADDEQIAVALQAQEFAARQQARGKFKSSEDLIHRLFVCIAGVADQLQTNFAADLRNILKSVFLMNQSPESNDLTELTPDNNDDKSSAIEYEATEDQVIQNHSSFDSVYSAEEVYADSSSSTSDSNASDNNAGRKARRNTVNSTILPAVDQSVQHDQPTNVEARRKSLDNVNIQTSVSTGDLTYRDDRRMDRESGTTTRVEAMPEWVPDIAAPACMRCAAHFTAFRRRHHCRNCGKVFCASCSSNSIPLPRYGQMKPVRVCDECFNHIATTNSCRRTNQR